MESSTNRAGWLGWVGSRFRRVTTSGRYMPEVDGLRFVAIAWVVFMHIHLWAVE